MVGPSNDPKTRQVGRKYSAFVFSEERNPSNGGNFDSRDVGLDDGIGM